MSEGKENIIELPSVAMRQIAGRMECLRESESTVLFQGESGAGKLTLARALIQGSPWADAPVLVLSAEEVPEREARAEIFGGSLHGAAVEGVLSSLHGGTLILCHVEYLPLHVQSALLRFLETGGFRRAGGMREERSEVRVLATIGSSIERRVVHGQFRRDLYQRLSGTSIQVPPLRQRSSDVEALAIHYCDVQAGRLGFEAKLSPESLQLLSEVPLPGNIRELRMHVEEALLEHGPGVITPASFATLRREGTDRVEEEPGHYGLYDDGEMDAFYGDDVAPLTLAEAENEHILRVLAVSDGNKTRAARTLGIARSTLIRKLEEIRKKSNGSVRRGYAEEDQHAE